MFSFGSPWWLLGIAIIPLVRWLHKYGGASNIIFVSSLLLWPASASHVAGTQKNRPDPIWMLRAFIVLLLFVTLAEPQWHTKKQAITIWLDQSRSMFTRESGITRIESGFKRLLLQLEAYKNVNITFRPITKPGVSLSLDPGNSTTENLQILTDWAKKPLANPLLDFMPRISSHSEHWLLTDGADKQFDAWLDKAPINKIIHVGNERENVSLARLSVRPSLVRPGKFSLILKISNHGRHSATRQVRLSIDNTRLAGRTIIIPAGHSSIQEYKIDTPIEHSIRARLFPNDHLALDDGLELSIAENTTHIAISDKCAKDLRTAISSMPWTQLTTHRNATADLRISCDRQTFPGPIPQLVFHSGKYSKPVKGIPTWSVQAAALKHLLLDSRWIKTFDYEAPTGIQTDILESAGNPLITQSANGPKSIHVWIDLNSSDLRQRPEFPVLLAGLMELVIGWPIAEGVLQITNPPKESIIAPRHLSALTPVSDTLSTSSMTSLEIELIILSMLLILFDLLISNGILSARHSSRT